MRATKGMLRPVPSAIFSDLLRPLLDAELLVGCGVGLALSGLSIGEEEEGDDEEEEGEEGEKEEEEDKEPPVKVRSVEDW